MSIAQDAELIQEVKSGVIQGEEVTLIILKGDKVLAVSHNALALYKNEALLEDPLGSGLVSSADVPGSVWKKKPEVVGYRSGLIEFEQGEVIFITPASFRLYPDKRSALHNHHLLSELPHQ